MARKLRIQYPGAIYHPIRCNPRWTCHPPTRRWRSGDPTSLCTGTRHSITPRYIFLLLVALTCSSTAFGGELHVAAQDGDLAKAKALLKANADLAFSRDTNGWTALHFAAMSGHKEVVELLLTNAAQVNATTSVGTPIGRVYAFKKYTGEGVAKIAQKETPLHMAACEGHRDVVELLLNNKAEVDARDFEGATPLHRAALGGHKDVMELLLASKADINATNLFGWTILHMAVYMEQRDVVEWLLVKNVNINAKACLGMTPLHVAAEGDYTGAAELLLAHKADVNVRSDSGRSPIFIAVDWLNKSMVELLLANEADINAKDGLGYTALHWAASDGRKDVVKFLLSYNVNVNTKSNSGEMPLKFAVSSGHKDVAQLLREHGGQE